MHCINFLSSLSQGELMCSLWRYKLTNTQISKCNKIHVIFALSVWIENILPPVSSKMIYCCLSLSNLTFSLLNFDPLRLLLILQQRGTVRECESCSRKCMSLQICQLIDDKFPFSTWEKRSPDRIYFHLKCHFTFISHHFLWLSLVHSFSCFYIN